MASPVYEQILSIQAMDLAIRRLTHQCEHHPCRKAVAEVEQSMDELAAEAGVVEEQKHELSRHQKRLEDEVATIEAKRLSIDGKLYGGEVTASKELLALQDEAASLLDRQRGFEDEQLELMEGMEGVNEQLSGLAERRSKLEAELARHNAELAAAIEELTAEIQATTAEREAAVAPTNPELLKRYEDMRDQYDGVAVARLVNSRCDGCHIQLSAVAVDLIGKMADDAVVNCEECGRLLVR